MLELYPAQDDAYIGDSLLQIKKIQSSTVIHEKEIHPPLTDDITKLKELITTQTLITIHTINQCCCICNSTNIGFSISQHCVDHGIFSL